MSVNPRDLGAPASGYATVFDVGAFIGDFAQVCLDEWPECRVESFEPLAEVQVTSDRWNWHTVALGAEHEIRTMYRNRFLASSSLLPMTQLHKDAFPYTNGDVEVRVEVEPLSKYAGRIERPALLKIDCQGFELEVLRGAGEELDEFQSVVLEVSHEILYEGAPTPDELSAFLLANGFSHKRRVDELWYPKGEGRLLQSDEMWSR